MLLIKFALRNLLRQKKRSAFTGLTMAGGVALFSIAIAWADGSYRGIIETFTRNRLGHIQIHSREYFSSPSIYKTIDDAYSIGEPLTRIRGVESWAPRIFAGGLGMVKEKTAAVEIVGIDPGREDLTSNFRNKIVEGSYLGDESEKAILIGKDLARAISAGIGDTLILLSQAIDGSIANDQYEIVGIVSFGNPAEDRIKCYMSIQNAWDLFMMHGKCHEIAVLTQSLSDVDRINEEISKIIPEDLESKTWKIFASEFHRAMQADRTGDMIFRMIIMLVISVGVFNSVLMSVLERTREYGLLKALGMKPSVLFGLIYTEFIFLAFISALAGIIAASPVIAYLSVKGVTLGQGFSYGGMIFREMKAEFTLKSFFEPFLFLLLSVAAVTLIPAMKALKTDPSAAMRDFG